MVPATERIIDHVTKTKSHPAMWAGIFQTTKTPAGSPKHDKLFAIQPNAHRLISNLLAAQNRVPMVQHGHAMAFDAMFSAGAR
jgi:hypothetical protein